MQKEIKSAQHCSHQIITSNLLQSHADSQQLGGVQAYLTAIYHHPSLQQQTYEKQKSALWNNSHICIHRVSDISCKWQKQGMQAQMERESGRITAEVNGPLKGK